MNKTFSISYDADRLTALSMYLEQKELTLNSEVEKLVDGLYQKTVPQNVRDFLDMKEKASKTKPTQPQSRPVSKTLTVCEPFRTECE